MTVIAWCVRYHIRFLYTLIVFKSRWEIELLDRAVGKKASDVISPCVYSDSTLYIIGISVIGLVCVICVDSDVNWWKGVSWRGEGLFPANFVTSDLTEPTAGQ